MFVARCHIFSVVLTSFVPSSGSFHDLPIDEDDSLIDISIKTEFTSGLVDKYADQSNESILDDLKAKLNNVTMGTMDLNEQRMNDLITEKLNAIR